MSEQLDMFAVTTRPCEVVTQSEMELLPSGDYASRARVSRFVSAPVSEAGELEFPTVRLARDWIEVNGWKPRHGGGYENGGRRASILPREGLSGGVMSVVVFE